MAINSRKIWRNIKALCFGVFFGLLICEIILRIYNPFPFALKKGKLILPSNQVKVYTNKWIPKLDRKIHYSRNSLGFRGPEPTDSVSRLLSIITIGGSTTECKFQSDSLTWSFLLYKALKHQNDSIWLNNAGIDGHSTFGHLLLLQEYVLKLKPKYALFLTGINDEEIEAPDEFDLMTEKKITTNSFKGFLKSVLNHTELGRTAFNFYHVQIAYKKGLIHRDMNIAELTDVILPDSVINRRIAFEQNFVNAYKERIDKIVSMCLEAGIQPVLITQPSLFGSYVDSASHISMGNKWYKNGSNNDNSLLEEKVLEMYNDVLRSFSNKIIVVDLARQMPKNSLYYYDFIHYTNAGAKKIAEILFSNLAPVIIHKTVQ
ncbi:MAG: SGNH/GDSL hydrolase family protein [Bacteroidota bacterium]